MLCAHSGDTCLHSYRLCPGRFPHCSPACSVFLVSLLTIISAVRLSLTAFLFDIAHVRVVVLCGDVWFGFWLIWLGFGHLLSYRQKSYSGPFSIYKFVFLFVFLLWSYMNSLYLGGIGPLMRYLLFVSFPTLFVSLFC